MHEYRPNVQTGLITYKIKIVKVFSSFNYLNFIAVYMKFELK